MHTKRVNGAIKKSEIGAGPRNAVTGKVAVGVLYRVAEVLLHGLNMYAGVMGWWSVCKITAS